MKRKIVQQGPTTLMVSLPIKWVHKFGLKKGEEIDLEEVGSEIIIRPKGKISKRDGEFDLFSEDGLYIWRFLQSLYILGYTQIKINFKSKKTLDIIQDAVTNFLIGFEIVNHTKNSCTIKQVSSEINEEFEVVMKRVFQNLLQMSEILLEYLEAGTSLDSLNNLEKTNNRHILYLKRIIISEKKFAPFYLMADLMEKIANRYKYLMLQKNKIKNSSSKLIVEIKKVNVQIEEIYENFYNYSEEKVEKMIANDLRPHELDRFYEKDAILASHIKEILSFSRNILSQIIILNQLKLLS